MSDMYLKGPDALKVLSSLGVNNFKGFGVNQAKQFVACNYDGYVIGDVILFYLDENLFNMVGRPSIHNWVQYHCETGGYDVTVERDPSFGRLTGTRFKVPMLSKSSRKSQANPRRISNSLQCVHSTLEAMKSEACVMVWPDNPDLNYLVHGKTAKK
jgi:hypothetical protein